MNVQEMVERIVWLGHDGFRIQGERTVYIDPFKIGDGPPAENEEVFEVDGFRVYIDKKSLFFLNGSELDYMDGLTGAGFKFRNPNATGTCGCGESFSV